MAEKIARKLCPLLKDNVHFALECLEEDCACHISVVKPAWISRAHGIVDPEQYYRYEGCGLVRVVPWQLVKREKAKTPEEVKPCQS